MIECYELQKDIKLEKYYNSNVKSKLKQRVLRTRKVTRYMFPIDLTLAEFYEIFHRTLMNKIIYIEKRIFDYVNI